MKKSLLISVAVLALGICLTGTGWAADIIKIGFDIELTGDIPKVGEASKFAGEMLKEQINSKGQINQQGTTILVVEQNARIGLKYAHRGYVLETGNIVLEGSDRDLAQDEKIKKAYLGK